mmetsp:Transcript_26014/g.78398  ORF Transcript_26014/g.78398 Transcript_26014/m.78398 type:complete len:278 (+) Transcript_26014:409-1242(+)
MLRGQHQRSDAPGGQTVDVGGGLGQHIPQSAKELVLRSEPQCRRDVVPLGVGQRGQVHAHDAVVVVAPIARGGVVLADVAGQGLGAQPDDVKAVGRLPRPEIVPVPRLAAQPSGVHCRLEACFGKLNFADELLRVEHNQVELLAVHRSGLEPLLAGAQHENHAVRARLNLRDLLADFRGGPACVLHQAIDVGLETVLPHVQAATPHDPFHELVVLDDAIPIFVYKAHDLVEVPVGELGVDALQHVPQLVHLDRAAAVAVPSSEGLLHPFAFPLPARH